VRSTARVLLACSLSLLVPAESASAQDVEDGQLWIQALAIGELSDNWRVHLELQPRVFNDASELGLTIVRTAIGRRLHPNVTAWAGHAWVPRSLGPATVHEQRLWQQLLLAFPSAAGWTPSARVRLEQRWLDPWVGTSHRLRLMMRAQRPLAPAGPWSVAFYNETMLTLDDTSLGPGRGFDRNRLYGGMVRRLSSLFSAELGYVWEHATFPGPLQRNDHVALGVININFALR
jgi:hypothetical protein